MDTNEKRPKRPRITTGAPRPTITEGTNEADNNRYERINYSAGRPYQTNDYSRNYSQENRQPRPYQPRNNGQHNPHSEEGYRPGSFGYQPRQNNWQNRTEQPRQEYDRFQHQRTDGYRQPRNNGYQPGANSYRQHQPDSYQQHHENNYRQGGGYGNRQDGYGRHENGFGRQQHDSQRGMRQQGNMGMRRPRQGYQQQSYGQQRQFGNRNNGNFGGKTFTATPRRIQYEMPIPDPNEEIRLNKFMANSGICSRREADEFIKEGLVKVNGQVVTELGTKITHKDTVEYDEKLVALENKCYILLNKPKDCVTTSDDPNGRITVMDLVKGACNERIYPVGRLDRNTTGVLLLTNDGDLASKLTHPKYIKRKIYHVWTDRDIAEEDMQKIADGIELEDGPIHADAISYANEKDRNQAGIEIHSGQNRIVRRIFEKLGYHVTKLDRVYFAGLTKKNLPRGRWRYLTQQEVNLLKRNAFE